jgi:hypothetical protein
VVFLIRKSAINCAKKTGEGPKNAQSKTGYSDSYNPAKTGGGNYKPGKNPYTGG